MKETRQIFKPDFLQIPFQLYDDVRIEPADRDVYAVCYWFEHLKDGKCTAGNNTIALLLNLTPRAIQNSFTKLEECGYILRHYKDESKRNRLSIECLISYRNNFKNERSGGDTRKSSEVVVTHERSGGDRASEVVVTRIRIGNKNSNTTPPPDGGAKLGSELIDLFKDVNPSYKQFFKRKNQHEAAERLVDIHGFDKASRVVKLLVKSNKIPYLPTIISPIQLEERWATLEAGLTKEKSKIKSKENYVL